MVLGIQKKSSHDKALYDGGSKRVVNNISPYLHAGRSVIVYPEKKPLKSVARMAMGNMPRDGGNLILSAGEANDLLVKSPECDVILRKYLGASEFLHSKIRWCLWIEDTNLQLAKSIPSVADRIQKVYQFRINSTAKTTNQYSTTPHKFAQRSHMSGSVVVVPRTSSENRDYIPFGFLDDKSILSDAIQVIYKAKTYTFGIMCSRMHMTWVRTVAGRLKTDFRYSSSLCYNTFPFPNISEKQKRALEKHVFQVLDEREKHSEKTMAQLYDPDKMPDGLRQAHHEMDLAVEQCYRKKPFTSDEERLEYLFKLYEKMIEAEKQK